MTEISRETFPNFPAVLLSPSVPLPDLPLLLMALSPPTPPSPLKICR